MSLPRFPGAKGCGWISKRKELDDFIIANNCSHQDKGSLITFPANKYQGNQEGTFPFDLPRCLLCFGPLWCCAVPGAGCEAEGIWGESRQQFMVGCPGYQGCPRLEMLCQQLPPHCDLFHCLPAVRAWIPHPKLFEQSLS